MNRHTDDLRIRAITTLSTPAEGMRDCAVSERASLTANPSRDALHQIIAGSDDRLAMAIGPYSRRLPGHCSH